MAKSKKSKNGSTTSIPSNNRAKSTPKNSDNLRKSPSDVPLKQPSPPVPPAGPQLPEGITPENSSPPQPPKASPGVSHPPPPEDVNPLTSEQYQAFRGKLKTGPFTWKALALFLWTGLGLHIYFRREKQRMERLRISLYYGTDVGVAEENKAVGTPRVGGPYSLIDHNGNKVTQETYFGKHTLVSPALMVLM
jgi:hypothetical protein